MSNFGTSTANEEYGEVSPDGTLVNAIGIRLYPTISPIVSMNNALNIKMFASLRGCQFKV